MSTVVVSFQSVVVCLSEVWGVCGVVVSVSHLVISDTLFVVIFKPFKSELFGKGEGYGDVGIENLQDNTCMCARLQVEKR